MAYNRKLADRIREYLCEIPNLVVEEKEMFRGLTFMVNGKLCICISDENLMCRFDPQLQENIAERMGYQPMIMRGKELNGYCYISPDGIKKQKDFEYFIKICLDFNELAKASKKKKHQ